MVRVGARIQNTIKVRARIRARIGDLFPHNHACSKAGSLGVRCNEGGRDSGLGVGSGLSLGLQVWAHARDSAAPAARRKVKTR